MSEDTKYQGWTNRATWAYNLHLDNDHGTYTMVQEWAKEAWEAAGAVDAALDVDDRIPDAVFALADQLQAFYDEGYDAFFDAVSKDRNISEFWRLLIGDLVSDEINFYEIARFHIEELALQEKQAANDK